jgi:hypothetical protein
MRTFASVKVDPGSVGVPVVPLNNNALADILGATFLVIGGLAVLFVLIGAVRYVTSAGDQNGIKQAKDTIMYALIGVVISLSAFTIVQFALGRLSGSL